MNDTMLAEARKRKRIYKKLLKESTVKIGRKWTEGKWSADEIYCIELALMRAYAIECRNIAECKEKNQKCTNIS